MVIAEMTVHSETTAFVLFLVVVGAWAAIDLDGRRKQ
jgi:hypothetical protein